MHMESLVGPGWFLKHLILVGRLWTVTTAANQVRRRQDDADAEDSRQKGKKNSNINNEVKETGEENKAVHNKWENRQSVSLRER